MKKIVKTAIGGALFAGMLVSNASAQADSRDGTTTFLRHMHSLGAAGVGGDADLIYGGMSICHELKDGKSIATVQAQMEGYAVPKGYSVSDADQIVIWAHDDLCPDAGR